MQVKKYLFCHCALEIKSENPVLPEKYYSNFLREFDKADFSFEVIKTDALPEKTGQCLFDSGKNSVYCDGETKKNYSAFYKGKEQAFTDFACKVNNEKLYISYPGEISEFLLFEGLRLPELLLEKGIGLLHCSFIEYDGQAILFAGDKQVGKSTQAALWEKHKNTLTVNGDRAGVYIKDDKVFAGGVPFCGMSDICENKQLPVKAIICLSKGTDNKAQKLSAFDSFMAILGKFAYNTWDKTAINGITDLVTKIVENVPVFSYTCRKDESAVNYLENVLKKEGKAF